MYLGYASADEILLDLARALNPMTVALVRRLCEDRGVLEPFTYTPRTTRIA